MNPEHLCHAATITQIKPAELSVLNCRQASALRNCEVSLDALNYLAKRMDGNDLIMPLRGKPLRRAQAVIRRAAL